MEDGLIGAGLTTLVNECGCLKPGERALIVTDPSTREIGERLALACRRVTERVEHLNIAAPQCHGQEPDGAAAAAMLGADLIFGLTKFSLAHTAARQNATARGSRYLSLPDYSWELLAQPALRVDYRLLRGMAAAVAGRLTAGRKVRITSDLGTDLELTLDGRQGNACSGRVEAAGELGSPPDAEANIAPRENASRGVIKVDGSIPCPGLGVLKAPLTVVVEAGEIREFQGDERVIERLTGELGIMTNKRNILAEFGLGLNPAASLCGVMLLDEGALGTVHFGFGSNHTIGGANRSDRHLDFVVRGATVAVDGELLARDGNLMIGGTAND